MLETERLMLERRYRTTVRMAVVDDLRTLVNSRGEVYLPKSNQWIRTDAALVKTLGPVYERWNDVPAAWLGGCPFWR